MSTTDSRCARPTSASPTDVSREAADEAAGPVLPDGHFATIVSAVEPGRAVDADVRRFLTYHLPDNVAELTPFPARVPSTG